MAIERCNSTATKTRRPCQRPLWRCNIPRHVAWRAAMAAKGAPDASPAAPDPPVPVATPAASSQPDQNAWTPEEQPWHASRDLRVLGWWVIDRLVSGALEARQAAVIGNLVRTLAALGPGAIATEQALREVELRGVLMYGIPPRTPEEWELAASIFDADALAEFRRWRPLLESDHHDREQPLVLNQGGADDVQVPGAVDDEDGA